MKTIVNLKFDGADIVLENKGESLNFSINKTGFGFMKHEVKQLIEALRLVNK